MLDLPSRRGARFSLVALSALFILAGINHFVNPDIYRPMMPPLLPAHDLLIWLSGILEIAGGIAVLFRTVRPAAGLFLIAIMIGVFPANVHMALNPELFAPAPAWGLWLRLPLQGLLIWWAWKATRPTIGEVA